MPMGSAGAWDAPGMMSPPPVSGEGRSFVQQNDGVYYPQFKAAQRKEVRAAFCSIGDRKSVFEDKVAVSSAGKYDKPDRQG